jgi:hypothetical protein
MVLAIDMEYCYKCGRKQEEQEQEPEKGQDEQA